MPPPNSAGPLSPSRSWLTIMMPFATRTLWECQPCGRELAGLARIGHVHDGGAARPVHVPDKERRALDPDLPTARAVEVRYESGVRSTRHETLDKVTFVGAATASRQPGLARSSSGDFYDAAGGVAAPLLEQVKAFQCGLIAGDEQDGGLPVVAVNVLEPGAARHR